MKTGIFFAIILHVAFLLFGGLIFGAAQDPAQTKKIVEVSLDDQPDDKKPDEPKPEEKPEEKIADAKDAPPDAEKMIRDMERPAVGAPALAEMDLSTISSLLNGGGGAEGFGQQDAGFGSGGIVGGKGKPGALGDKEDQTFSAAEIDQPPRAEYQVAPTFPAEMRGKNLDGQVVVIFIVTAEGLVTSQRVDHSNHPAFEKPALEAVKQWRFEPGLRAGQKVATRMKVTVRFQRS